MAENQLQSSLPIVTLDADCTVTIEAISPTTGAAVAGVTVSQVTIYATNASDELGSPGAALEFGATFAFAGDDE